MDPVVHFEMPYHDRGRMAAFYRAAFGWNTQELGPEMGHYVLATTTESGERGPLKPGAINGGFHPHNPEMPGQHPSVVIAVQDIDQAMARVTKAGGQVLGEPMPIPGVGKYVAFNDSEGNNIRMLEPDMSATGGCPEGE